jgi:predicted deacetylase
MWIAIAILAVIIIAFLFEYRIRKPDEIIVYESTGIIRKRKKRLYPRHFSLAISGTIHSTDLKVEAEAKGKISLHVHMVATVAASVNHLQNLVRAGGWHKDNVVRALKELDNSLRVVIKEFTEKHEIENLFAEQLSAQLQKKIGNNVEELGLDIISLNVYAIDPVDDKIAESIQQRETARIVEETERTNQKARVTVTKAKLAADEQIAIVEHDLELKKYKLKKIKEEEEAKIANLRIKEELDRRKLQLEFDRKEVDLLKDNPELLILSPQMAKLAEASQSLPNARTVVNLSGKKGMEGTQLINLIEMFLQNLVDSTGKSTEKKRKLDD